MWHESRKWGVEGRFHGERKTLALVYPDQGHRRAWFLQRNPRNRQRFSSCERAQARAEKEAGAEMIWTIFRVAQHLGFQPMGRSSTR